MPNETLDQFIVLGLVIGAATTALTAHEIFSSPRFLNVAFAYKAEGFANEF